MDLYIWFSVAATEDSAVALAYDAYQHMHVSEFLNEENRCTELRFVGRVYKNKAFWTRTLYTLWIAVAKKSDA